ncbi:hypothetical protein SLE2022_015740 [Rubroshorea leprosula]
MCTLYCHISSPLRAHLPGRHKHDILPDRLNSDNSFNSVDLLLKSPKIQLVTHTEAANLRINQGCAPGRPISQHHSCGLIKWWSKNSSRTECEVASPHSVVIAN